MVLDCPALNAAVGAAISSKAEVAVQGRQARHSHGHGTGMARDGKWMDPAGLSG